MAAKKAPEAGKLDVPPISVEVAARLLMISAERVRQLVKLGYVKRSGRGGYDLTNVVQGYVGFLKDEERRSSKSAGASRMQDAKTAEIEMRLAERRRELVPVEEAQAIVDQFVALIQTPIEALPARVTRDLELRKKLQDEVDGILNTVADGLERWADYREKGGDPFATASADDA